MAAPGGPLLTVYQYLDLCETSPAKWEYHDRRAFPLGEGAIQHALIVGQFIHLLEVKQKDSHVRRRQVRMWRFRLPAGLSIACRIWSYISARYDASEKFELYQAIESLEEYVLVSQNRHKVAVFTKNESGWQLRTYTGLDATVTLHSLGVNISIAELYEGVEFENAQVRGAAQNEGQDASGDSPVDGRAICRDRRPLRDEE